MYGSSEVDSALDEVILVVAEGSARLYCPSATWPKLAPLVAMWPRLQLWLPPASLSEDTERLEEDKIVSFIEMVDGIKCFGVPLPEVGVGPAAAVEAWPLVQAFALQEFEKHTGAP